MPPECMVTEYARHQQYFGESHVMDAFVGAGYHKDQHARMMNVTHSMETACEKVQILDEYYNSVVKQHSSLVQSGAMRSASALGSCK